MLTVGTKIKQIAGLAGSADVDDRTGRFIIDMVAASENGRRTSHLSDKQVEWIEDIHAKHFGQAQG